MADYPVANLYPTVLIGRTTRDTRGARYYEMDLFMRPPAISFIGPEVIAEDGRVEFLVESSNPGGLQTLYVRVFYLDRGESVIDIADGAFIAPNYSAEIEPIGGSARISIARNGGWPEVLMVVVITAADGGGENTERREYTIDPPPEPVVDDKDPPSVGNLVPEPGTPIERSTPVSLEVTDDSGAFRRVILVVSYDAGELAGVTEVAYDGDSFVGHYVAGRSARQPIDNGFRFTLLRNNGWPASPTVRVFAIDEAGNEA